MFWCINHDASKWETPNKHGLITLPDMDAICRKNNPPHKKVIAAGCIAVFFGAMFWHTATLLLLYQLVLVAVVLLNREVLNNSTTAVRSALLFLLWNRRLYNITYSTMLGSWQSRFWWPWYTSG